MKQFLRALFLFLVLVIVVSYPVSYLISRNFNTYNKQDWILNVKDQSFDYALIGSSRVFNMIDVNTLNASSSKNGVNIGTSGSCYAESYILLSEFLKTNSTKMLIMNIDEFAFNTANSYSYPFHDLEFLPLFNEYDQVFRDFIPTWKYMLWKVLPAARYCEFNSTYTFKKTLHTGLDRDKGSLLITGEEDHKENENKTLSQKRKQSKIADTDEKYFNKILDLCEAKKIQVVLITTPIYSEQKNAYGNFVREFITKRQRLANIPYLPFDDLIDNSNKDYFTDYTHTNIKGSLAYSEALGKKLRSFDLH